MDEPWWSGRMAYQLSTPPVPDLPHVIASLRSWQVDSSEVMLHPGDVGWHWMVGAESTAEALRTWSREGELLAVGMFDGPGLIRLAIAPAAVANVTLAEQMADDVTHPERGVLRSGQAAVEARWRGPFRDILTSRGWGLDDPWAQFQRDLSDPVEVPEGVDIEVVTANRWQVRADLQNAAFNNSSTSTHFETMAAGLPYQDAQCLIASVQGTPVGMITVWSAGAGRPGLIEPMGVHPDHRSCGYGRALTLAGCAALQQMGASAARVATEIVRDPAIATYTSTMTRLTDSRDLTRPGE